MEINGAQGGQFEAARKIARGVQRMLSANGWSSLNELCLPDGRRADIFALASNGETQIIEIKSSIADFRADQKWPYYRDFCDSLSFAIDLATPPTLIPEEAGLIIADAFDARIIRQGAVHRLAPARRKAMVQRFAKAAADRLHALNDPDWRLRE